MTAPALIAQKLTKEYRMGSQQVHALTDASLAVERGEIALVIGPSGSGKTTLLSIVGCVLRPTSGDVSIDGNAVSDLSEAALPLIRREKIGFIFQSFNLLRNLTALENVALTARLRGLAVTAARSRAQELLSALDMEHRLRFVPNDLSGGERQRVAVARALANDPVLILADEPTANLDSRTGHQVTGLLRELARTRGKAVVIASHDERLVDLADSLYRLQDGTLEKML